AGVLARHQALLRSAFERWHGSEVSTEGDSFFVAFPRATDAVAAALDGQRALATEPWPEGSQVRVRMGLHTGQPRIESGTYLGLDVHRAARIAAAGHGGQVLLSQTTRDLAEQAVPDEASLVDLGTHRLKDLPNAER